MEFPLAAASHLALPEKWSCSQHERASALQNLSWQLDEIYSKPEHCRHKPFNEKGAQQILELAVGCVSFAVLLMSVFIANELQAAQRTDEHGHSHCCPSPPCHQGA